MRTVGRRSPPGLGREGCFSWGWTLLLCVCRSQLENIIPGVVIHTHTGRWAAVSPYFPPSIVKSGVVFCSLLIWSGLICNRSVIQYVQCAPQSGSYGPDAGLIQSSSTLQIILWARKAHSGTQSTTTDTDSFTEIVAFRTYTMTCENQTSCFL